MEKVTIKKSDIKYLILGKVIVFIVGWGLCVAGFIWAFLQNTIY